MARTYWDKKPDGALEFLGAFRDGYVVKDQKWPQARGVVIDIPDLDIAGVLDALADRVRLEALPSPIRKRITAGIPATVPWAQLAGFVK